MHDADFPDSTLLPVVNYPHAEDYTSRQMQLFQDFIARDGETKQRLSNSLDFWDAIPKYSVNRSGLTNHLDTSVAPSLLNREFIYQNIHYRLEIQPALVRDQQTGALKYVYPTLREEVVEDALRKIACQQYHGFFSDATERPRSGVRFSLYALRKFLRERDHTLNLVQLKESLLILAGCHLEVVAIGNRLKKQINASILNTLIITSRAERERDADCFCYAEFHPLITDAIAAIQYRQFDLLAVLRHRKPLARWLHKYFIRTALNASPVHPIKLSLQFVKTTSGLLGATRWRDDARTFRAAIAELISHNVITNAQEKAVLDKENQRDLQYILTPSASLVADIVAANQRCRQYKQEPPSGATATPPAGRLRPIAPLPGPSTPPPSRPMPDNLPRPPERLPARNRALFSVSGA